MLLLPTYRQSWESLTYFYQKGLHYLQKTTPAKAKIQNFFF